MAGTRRLVAAACVAVALLIASGCRRTTPPAVPASRASPESRSGSRLTPLPAKITVPILMYHHIADPPTGAGGSAAQLYVRPEAFEEQMAYLAEADYDLIAAGELAAALMGRRGLPPEPAVLTFDDGYSDFRTRAWPVLQRHGFAATLLISTGAVGTANHLTWDELRELHAAGVEIASHGVTHRSLTALDRQTMARELADSKRLIEAEIGAPVRVFAYPAGTYDPNVIAATAAAGYEAGLTADLGFIQGTARPYELKRSRIKLRHDLALFQARIGADQ